MSKGQKVVQNSVCAQKGKGHAFGGEGLERASLEVSLTRGVHACGAGEADGVSRAWVSARSCAGGEAVGRGHKSPYRARSYSNATSSTEPCLVPHTGNPLNRLHTLIAPHLWISLTFTTSCFALPLFVCLLYFHYALEEPEPVLPWYSPQYLQLKFYTHTHNNI